MSPEEIRFAWSLVPGFGFGAVVAGLLVYLLAKHFMPGYLAQKGKNLADKEDIAALTREVEKVKQQHAEVLEAVKFRNQLRMAGIDRRLQAHQEAFTLLHELVMSIHGEDVNFKVHACQTWWSKNCLYLEPDARDAFLEAFSSASHHERLNKAAELRRRVHPHDDVEAFKDVRENWERITGAVNIVLNAVALPPLTDAEFRHLRTGATSSQITEQPSKP